MNDEISLKASYRVAIIDDDAAFAHVMSRMLQRGIHAHYEVELVDNYEAGLELIVANHHDLYFVDVRLDNRNGLDLIKEARAQNHTGAMVVLTGTENPDVDARALEVGADDFLNKDGLDTSLLERTVRYSVQARFRDREARENNEQLQRIQDQLVQSEKLETIGRMAASIAHDLRNPLQVLNMGIQMLSRDGMIEKASGRAALEQMVEALPRAERITEELLELSAPRDFEFKDEALPDLISSTYLFQRSNLAKAGVNWREDFEENLPLVRMDRNKIIQVLINLIENARHAMPEGGTLTVRMARCSPDSLTETQRKELAQNGHQDEDLVSICLLDTGTGIPEDLLQKIYAPFFTTKPVGVGTGLGLDISRGILQKHCGVLHLSNRAEGGACATLLLPAL